MLHPWINNALRLSAEKANFYSGARKILRNRSITFKKIEDDLAMGHCGFTKSKMSMLIRLYRQEESIRVAKELWSRRVEQDKYGSVGFTTYNHLIKNDPSKKSKRASVMGPCIQSVVLTFLPERRTAIDCFYRTTEFFKKFPADLVFLRDNLLPGFDFKKTPIAEVNFHFANITMHPMYWVTLVPHLIDPVRTLDELKRRDKYFYNWVVKWTARYLCEEYSRGILKFSQALRVRDTALANIEKSKLKELQKYLRKNHPGYRGDKQESDDEDI